MTRNTSMQILSTQDMISKCRGTGNRIRQDPFYRMSVGVATSSPCEFARFALKSLTAKLERCNNHFGSSAVDSRSIGCRKVVGNFQEVYISEGLERFPNRAFVLEDKYSAEALGRVFHCTASGAPVDIFRPLVSSVIVSSNLHSMFYPCSLLGWCVHSLLLLPQLRSAPKLVKRKSANYVRKKWNCALTIYVYSLAYPSMRGAVCKRGVYCGFILLFNDLFTRA